MRLRAISATLIAGRSFLIALLLASVIACGVNTKSGGIPAEDLSNIFEELYRGSNARGVEGSGLGLALVRRIVALHGGEIDVRSRQEEPRGTVFTVRLPVSTHYACYITVTSLAHLGNSGGV